MIGDVGAMRLKEIQLHCPTLKELILSSKKIDLLFD
jgi:hypothetical protein